MTSDNTDRTGEASARGSTRRTTSYADGDPDREFTVHAVPVDVVYNRFGLHQPEAALFVLDEHLDDALAADGEAPPNAFRLLDGDGAEPAEGDPSLLRPLVLRAEAGDEVRVTLVNHLDRRVSLHQTSLPYDVDQSDGLAVGYNDDSTVAPGEDHTYEWQAAHVGTHFFMDGANQAWDSTPSGDRDEVNGLAAGLYGALVVEPAGSEWFDPETGDELRSGVAADVYDADLDTWYREFVVFYSDPDGVVTAEGDAPTWPGSDHEQTVHAINNRAELTGQRLQDRDDCDDCTDIAGFYSSWVHGDPGGGDNVYETYAGDPVKMVAVGANIEENHVHHLHGHRWKEIQGVSESDTIDAETLAMGTSHEAYLATGHGEGSTRPEVSFEEAFEVGAGSEHESAGDYLFHCHLFPHYAEGMNASMRVNDTEREWLEPLPTNDPPIAADDDADGFPEFMPCERGKLPAVDPGRRSMEPAEKEVLDQPTPGAPYADPTAGDEVAETRHYTIVAMDADIVYNDAGHHDPDGEVYVLARDEGRVRDGSMNPEPLVLRANVGDRIVVTFRNEMSEGKSVHPHFVRYDVQGSDSLMNGYNYAQGVAPGEEEQFEWYANEEGPVFFHDHITGVEQIVHGSFATIVVEPEDSTWHDPHTGREIRRGTQAMIQDPNGEDFREFVLLYHDFAPLVDRDGEHVNRLREHNRNAGVMAINYRNEPYYVRGEEPDPAYLHSSAVHGDPATPTLEAYAGDPVRIRNVMAAYEEQHNFSVHGVDLGRVGVEPSDQMAEVIGTSQARTFALREDPDFDVRNPDGLPVTDYLYGSTPIEDRWDGMWGVFRLFGGEVDHLRPLPDRSPPAEQISARDLADMGHPAAFDNPSWRHRGHVAKLLYTWRDDDELPPDAGARKNESVGEVPPSAPEPDGDADRTYDVTAVQTEISFNEYGDHDPHGIAFVPDDEVEAVRSGQQHPEPLVLRANAGETVDVRLTNELPRQLDGGHAHPQTRTPRGGGWDVSSRTSLHPVNADHEVQHSDGAAVGFNYDSTVAPGESRTYRWRAEADTDGCVLWDVADVRGHRHHGASGQFVVEPAGSEWVDPDSGLPVETAARALIRGHDEEAFLEFVLTLSDGRYVVNDDGSCVVPDTGSEHDDGSRSGCNQVGDPEDQGYVAINNRAEPFARRFDADDRQHRVFSSEIHGDPATPVLEASPGDRVKLRVAQTGDRQRGAAFHLAGHQWEPQSHVEHGSIAPRRTGVQHDLTPGKAHTLEPLGGAGGLADGRSDRTGDYLFQEMKQRRRLEAGWWGILRVSDD